jgi:UDP-N-acetylmuramoyl-tripeptide--D-alanyl-D-alanine ligase
LSDATARSSRRMEPRQRNGVLILNDAYNANPESMRAALETLAWVGRDRPARTWAVLGPMAELGDTATAEHETVGRLAAQLDVGRLVAVGEQARAIAQGASSAGLDAVCVPDTDAAITLLRAQVRPGDVVLVKASRSASLERVAIALGDEMAAEFTQARP